MYSTAIVIDINGNVINPIAIPVTQGVTYDVQILSNCHSPKSGVNQQIAIFSNSTPIGAIIGNDSSTVCLNGTSVTLYMDGAFAIGKVLYTDNALTTPLVGYLFLVYGGEIYNVNNTNGIVISDTTVSCTTNNVIVTAQVGFGFNSGQISNVSNLEPFALSSTLAAGHSVSGYHNAISSVNIDFTVENVGTGDGCDVYKNSIFVERINFSGVSGVFSTSAITAGTSDIIELNFNNNL